MLGWFRRRKRAKGAAAWRDASLFEGLSDGELSAVEPFVKPRRLRTGELLVREGDPAEALFIVRAGTLELFKRGQGGEHSLGQLGTGEVVGEVALFDELPRFLSVRASSACELFEIDFHTLRERARGSRVLARAYHRLLESLAAALADRLRAHAAASVEHARHRAAVGRFLVHILVLLCLYSFLLSGLELLGEHAPANTTWVSIPLQLVFAVGSWRIIRGSGYPLSEFGIGFRQLFGSILEAAIFTPPVLLAVTAMKWLLIVVTGNPREVALLAHPDVGARLADPAVLRTLGIYALSCVVQELIVRSALQSSLERFLIGPRRVAHAVVVAALLFSVTHLHISFLFALLAFVPGLFWGWLFARRRNLVGVTLSHVVVGGYVFFVLGAVV